MRRFAQLSRYASGSLASDMASREAATERALEDQLESVEEYWRAGAEPPSPMVDSIASVTVIMCDWDVLRSAALWGFTGGCELLQAPDQLASWWLSEEIWAMGTIRSGPPNLKLTKIYYICKSCYWLVFSSILWVISSFFLFPCSMFHRFDT